MANPFRESPCPDCPKWGIDMDSCTLSCQLRINFLHLAFGEPWYSIAERDRQDKAEIKAIFQGQQYHPPAEKAKLYRVTCPICGQEVLTKFQIQKTCGKEACKTEHKRKRDRENARLKYASNKSVPAE